MFFHQLEFHIWSQLYPHTSCSQLSGQVSLAGWEMMVSSCAKGGLDWNLGEISSPEDWWNIGTDCPGGGGVTWRYSRPTGMWHWGLWAVCTVGWVGLGWGILGVFSDLSGSVSLSFYVAPLGCSFLSHTRRLSDTLHTCSIISLF